MGYNGDTHKKRLWPCSKVAVILLRKMDFKSPGLIDLEAFKAGNDVLLISEDIPKAILKIQEAAIKNQYSC